jgi:hypothetical protein
MHKFSKVIIIVVHVRAMKIYMTIMEALRKKERQDKKNLVYHQN